MHNLGQTIIVTPQYSIQYHTSPSAPLLLSWRHPQPSRPFFVGNGPGESRRAPRPVAWETSPPRKGLPGRPASAAVVYALPSLRLRVEACAWLGVCPMTDWS